MFVNDSMPDVKTVVRVGELTIEIFAYRSLSADECRAAIRSYLRANSQSRLPDTGTVRIYSLLGSLP